MMKKIKYTKKPLSISAQISQMKQKGINITDVEKASDFLKNNNFYKMSFYYKNLIVDANNIDFDTCCELYLKDRELSKLLLNYISILEDAIKTRYAYEYSMSTKSSHPHLNENNYVKDYHEMINILAKLLESNSLKYKEHYKNKYSERLPPIWVLVEALPLGNLSNLIKKTRSVHIKNFYASFNYPENLTKSFLYSLAFVRNLCAHNAVLWKNDSESFPKLPYVNDINQNFKIQEMIDSDILKRINYENKKNIYNFIIIMIYIFEQLEIESNILSDMKLFFSGIKNDYMMGYGIIM